MANETTISKTIQCINGVLRFAYSLPATSFDQSTQGAGEFTLSVTVSEVPLSLPGNAAPGILALQNLDTSNYVRWGTSTGVYPFKLSANSGSGEIEFNGTPTIYLSADTATCLVQVIYVNA